VADGDQSPVNPRDAFEDIRDGFDSRITFLLMLGAMYGRGRTPILEEIEENREEFPMPSYEPGNRLRTVLSVLSARDVYGLNPTEIRNLNDQESPDITATRRRSMASLVQRLYEDPIPDIVGQILILGLGDPNELIRVSAAISFLDLFDEVGLALTALLSVIEDGSDAMAAQLAEIAIRKLGRTAATSFRTPSPGGVGPPLNMNATILVHGTQFSFVGSPMGDWWTPKGDFHNYIRSSYRPNLYSKPDFFSWSGGWSDHARQLAAIDLRNWTRSRKLSGFDLIAHSHGGNVAMWATQLGMELNKLILLSCPAHVKHYLPEFARVNEVISYQIKFDWAILTDGGGTKFRHPSISDHILPKWFRCHEDTHKPDFWRRYGLSI
jgi:pimeloyl-ACP methyl ester carboxylesterase